MKEIFGKLFPEEGKREEEREGKMGKKKGRRKEGKGGEGRGEEGRIGKEGKKGGEKREAGEAVGEITGSHPKDHQSLEPDIPGHWTLLEWSSLRRRVQCPRCGH